MFYNSYTYFSCYSSEGTYGDTYGLTSAACSGPCHAGYLCLTASPSPTQYECGANSSVYCPVGSSAPSLVPAGFYSRGRTLTTRSAILPCPSGMYCMDGLQYECPAGRFSRSGSRTEECDGLCAAGYYCPTSSSSATQFSCPAGRFGSLGMGTAACTGSCLRGYYCPPNSTVAHQNECGNEYVYCPHGVGAPIPVSRYYYSSGGNITTRFEQRKCIFDRTLGTPPAAELRRNLCPSTTVWV